MVSANQEAKPKLFKPDNIFAITIAGQDQVNQDCAQTAKNAIIELGTKEENIETVLPKPGKLKTALNQLIVRVLNKRAKGEKTLIWIYAKGSSVKVDNMHEMLVEKENVSKSFPLEKVVRGLATAVDAYVVALYDLEETAPQAVMAGAQSNQIKSVKGINWLSGYPNQMELIQACRAPNTQSLLTDFFQDFKTTCALDGTICIP